MVSAHLPDRGKFLRVGNFPYDLAPVEFVYHYGHIYLLSPKGIYLVKMEP